METPLSGRSRPRHASKLKKSSPLKTSTPLSNMNRSSKLCSVVGRKEDGNPSPGCNRTRGLLFDTDDDMLPLTQNMVNPKTGVHWNYEDSPSAKAELRRLMKENGSGDEDEGILPSPKPITPVIKMRVDRKRPPSPMKMCEEAVEIFESMKEIGAKIQADQKRGISATNPFSLEAPFETSCATSRNNSKWDDGFGGSDENSLLIRCTQEAEQQESRRSALKPCIRANPKDKPTSVAMSSPSKVKKSNDDFLDDESFDQLLLQIDIPPLQSNKKNCQTTFSATASSSSITGKSVNPNPRNPNFSTISKSTEVLDKSCSTWKRALSSPEATSGLLSTTKTLRQRPSSISTVKCTHEQIEKKRLEAIQKRQHNPKESKKADARNKLEVTSSERDILPQRLKGSCQTVTSDTSSGLRLSAKSPVNQGNLNSFHRKNEESTKNHSTWRRVESNPEASTTCGSLLPSAGSMRRYVTVSTVQCTREEIEKKRQEAIRKRQRSQQRDSTEADERNKVEITTSQRATSLWPMKATCQTAISGTSSSSSLMQKSVNQRDLEFAIKKNGGMNKNCSVRSALTSPKMADASVPSAATTVKSIDVNVEKCTREEIEKKRLEAIRKRQCSQQPESQKTVTVSGKFLFKKILKSDIAVPST